MSEVSEIITGVVAKASGDGGSTDIPKLSGQTMRQLKVALRKIAATLKNEDGTIEYGALIQQIEEI